MIIKNKDVVEYHKMLKIKHPDIFEQTRIKVLRNKINQNTRQLMEENTNGKKR